MHLWNNFICFILWGKNLQWNPSARRKSEKWKGRTRTPIWRHWVNLHVNFFLTTSLPLVKHPVTRSLKTTISTLKPGVHITREFENVCFPLKTHPMFSVHSTPVEFRNARITGHFGIMYKDTSVREITSIWHRFQKSSVFKNAFPSSKQKQTASAFKFLRFDERIRKPPCS